MWQCFAPSWQWYKDSYHVSRWLPIRLACTHTRAIFGVRGSFPKLNTDKLKTFWKNCSLFSAFVSSRLCVAFYKRRWCPHRAFLVRCNQNVAQWRHVSAEHSEHYGSFGLFQDVHSLGMSHALQAVSIHSNDLIATFQPAVLDSCPLQGAKSPPSRTDQRSQRLSNNKIHFLWEM